MDKKEAVKIVKNDSRILKNLPDHFKKDKEFIAKIVKQDGYALEYAHKSLNKQNILSRIIFYFTS